MKLLSFFCVETLDQKILQCNSIIMLRVMRSVDQCKVAVARCFQYRAPRSWIVSEFGKVTQPKLFPSCRIVMKPFPQFDTGLLP